MELKEEVWEDEKEGLEELEVVGEVCEKEEEFEQERWKRRCGRMRRSWSRRDGGEVVGG